MAFEIHLRSLVEAAAIKLDMYRMIRYNRHLGTLMATDLGRTASYFYIKCETVEVSLILLILLTVRVIRRYVTFYFAGI